MLGLQRGRVDFLRRRLAVEEQSIGLVGQPPMLAPLKTKRSRRVVPLDDVVLEAIAEHVATFGGPRVSMADHTGGERAVDLLLTSRVGAPVRGNAFGQCWREAVLAAGLPSPGTRFHDLRHYFASALIADGQHPKIIQSRLGHATIAETMDTYGHLFPDAEDSGRGALDRALGRVDGSRSAMITEHTRSKES